MRIDKLTSKLQLALSDAQSLALKHKHNYIEPAHLLFVLLEQGGGSLKLLLSQTGFPLGQLQSKLLALIETFAQLKEHDGEISISNDMVKMLNQAELLSSDMGDSYVSSETIMLVAMKADNALAKILNSFGVSPQALKTAINNLRSGETVDSANGEENFQSLERFCVDVTAKAQRDELDPVIGR
ncbi:MAG: type VI secretion system ATPase TssH, partial [SAR86 cluster bacterium]